MHFVEGYGNVDLDTEELPVGQKLLIYSVLFMAWCFFVLSVGSLVGLIYVCIRDNEVDFDMLIGLTSVSIFCAGLFLVLKYCAKHAKKRYYEVRRDTMKKLNMPIEDSTIEDMINPKYKIKFIVIVKYAVAFICGLVLLILGLCIDAMWLGAIGLSAIMITIILAQRAFRKNQYKNMTDKSLINLYEKYANDIQTALVANGLTGLGSGIATEKVNNDIQRYREKGQLIGEELQSRGYKIDFSVLNGKVIKGKSKPSVIKGAVVGGIIAGKTGAIVGAMHEMNKNNKNNKK